MISMLYEEKFHNSIFFFVILEYRQKTEKTDNVYDFMKYTDKISISIIGKLKILNAVVKIMHFYDDIFKYET